MPVTPQFFAWRANNPEVVDELLGRTGSRLDPALRGFYRRLFRNPAHVGGALGMMANWDLPSLDRELPRLKTPLLLIAGAMDGMVPPEDASLIAGRVKGARAIRLKGLGHLAHEEEPGLIADLIRRAFAGLPLDVPAQRGRDVTTAASDQLVLRVARRRKQGAGTQA
jgi:magnesium chelatase accessory protein